MKPSKQSRDNAIELTQVSAEIYRIRQGETILEINFSELNQEACNEALILVGELEEKQALKYEAAKIIEQNCLNKLTGIQLLVRKLTQKSDELDPSIRIYLVKDPTESFEIDKIKAAELVEKGSWSYSPERITTLTPVQGGFGVMEQVQKLLAA